MQNNITDKLTVKDLADLAMETESVDPIDWGMLNISESEAYLLMASSVLEMVRNQPDEHKLPIALASLTKLTVENFVLNLKLKACEDSFDKVWFNNDK